MLRPLIIMASILDNRLNTILKTGVTPLLKELGVKKGQLIYSCDFDGLSWLVDIQKSRWNDEEEAQFTVNCGIYVPGVLSVYANMPEPAKPKIEHCSCSARIGMLTPEKKDIWWKLTSGDSDSVDGSIAQDLRSKIENVALPFVNKFKLPQAVANFLSSDLGDEYSQVAPATKAQRFAYSAIIHSKLGNGDAAKRILSTAVEASKKSPIEDIVKNLKLKI